MRIEGLHHVTAITGDPQTNIDFYTGVLGLRLVKLTVNFDDPNSYHLYYGDAMGRPGTILTFFAWPGAFGGRVGTSQITATAFSVPPGSLDYWTNRLADAGIDTEGPFDRFHDKVLRFADVDNLQLELIEPARADTRQPWQEGTVSPKPEQAIRGLHSVTISQEHYEATAGLLTEAMGLRRGSNEAGRFRYETAAGGAGATVDVLNVPGTLAGAMGVGVVHHVAWRTPDDDEQAAWRVKLMRAGTSVTPVRDRVYFHSIYFREAGGVLFEIATDAPGFAIDEPPEHLGSRLQLPPWLESLRPQLEHVLPPLRLPSGEWTARQSAPQRTRQDTSHELG